MVRGVALFGVLMVNLLWDFRVPLFQLILHPDHSPIGAAVRLILEFKSMDLFCLTFGMGVAIQSARAAKPYRLLLRRFAVLLAIGLIHILLIWNGDILTLYAICGLLLIPLLKLKNWQFGVIAAALFFVTLGPLWPAQSTIDTDIARAAIYGSGSWVQILQFRTWETLHLFGPLILMTLPKTLCLMLAGVAAWRSNLPRRIHPAFAIPLLLMFRWSDVPVAFGYAILLFRFWRGLTFFRWAGQMALTNYLTESIVLSILFYGFGFGLFNKLDPAPAAAIGILLYCIQLVLSRWWLRTHRFGPFEYLWRWATYGRRPVLTQPLPL